MKKKITVLPGDGIGPEVMKGALQVLEGVAARFGHEFQTTEKRFGGTAIDQDGKPLPDDTLETCKNSDAVLLGAVGGPKWDSQTVRPEQGLLALRKELNVFANLRPVTVFPGLENLSPLKSNRVKGADFVFVRELTGGIYFSEPKTRDEKHAVDTLSYTREEITRIIEKAYELARVRRKKVTSVDKANVLETSKLWREIVEETAKKYSDVETEHLLVDYAAMRMISSPSSFDVVVTENMFGDILSDEASVIPGSLGMMPSASISQKGPGLYEPIHGSAPDIAGSGKANPIGMILSTAMMLRHSFKLEKEAAAVELAVFETLQAGYRTQDIYDGTGNLVSTKEMVNQIHFRMIEDSTSATLLEVYV
ncbi:3-isopropylmalate dehydrogenase [Fictibacillus arsenicus]|uniref:3-isopropylmalate dehydrogenase n=1 Tax=Fictibacillus arsenicus TaxID=255247 RepID=A0A1B1Z6Z7_9BACL|nr:3-isopropylmalate dehydrogenase [Fictibacillus arsenicus]ANX13109.1 3-isopropylmalate dehydrogenase [Fictibacillus arsenicus]